MGHSFSIDWELRSPLIFLALYFFALLKFGQQAVVQVSNPFDPYRLECPHKFAIVKLTLQRVESVGGARNDTMIASFCENVLKLYPSNRDEISPADDENCRWTQTVQIPGFNFGFNEICGKKEFIAGISRQEELQYGFLCCKLKDRKRKRCYANRYSLPTKVEPEVAIEREQLLLSSLAYQDTYLIAQFCEYSIMNQDEIDQEIIHESKSKLAAWFASQTSTRPPPIRENLVPTTTTTESPEAENGRRLTLFPGDPGDGDDNNNIFLPFLIPRDKNAIAPVGGLFPSTRHATPSHFTQRTIGLKSLKPNSPVRYTLSPEEEAALAFTPPLEEEEDNSRITLLPLLQQRASLSALLGKRFTATTSTTRKRARFDFRTTNTAAKKTSTTTPSVQLTSETVEEELTLNPSEIGEDDLLVTTALPVVQQRASVANFLNQFATRNPQGAKNQIQSTHSVSPTTPAEEEFIGEVTENPNDEDASTNADALDRARASLSKLLNQLNPTTKSTTTTTRSTTPSTTTEFAETVNEQDLEDNSAVTIGNAAFIQQRASLALFLGKAITVPTTKSKTKLTTATSPTTEFAAEEITEDDENGGATAEDPLVKQRASLAVLIGKAVTTPASAHQSSKSTPTGVQSVDETPELAEEDKSKEQQFNTTLDPIAKQLSSLAAFLHMVFPTTTTIKPQASTITEISSTLPSKKSRNSTRTTKSKKKSTTISPINTSEAIVELEIATEEANVENLEEDNTVTPTITKRGKSRLTTRATTQKSTRQQRKKPTTTTSVDQSAERVDENGNNGDENPEDITTTTLGLIKVRNGKGQGVRKTKPTITSSSSATSTTTTTEKNPDIIEITQNFNELTADENVAAAAAAEDQGQQEQKNRNRAKPPKNFGRERAPGEKTIKKNIKNTQQQQQQQQQQEETTETRQDDNVTLLPDPPAVVVIPPDYELSPSALKSQNNFLIKSVALARSRVHNKQTGEEISAVDYDENNTTPEQQDAESPSDESEFTLTVTNIIEESSTEFSSTSRSQTLSDRQASDVTTQKPLEITEPISNTVPLEVTSQIEHENRILNNSTLFLLQESATQKLPDIQDVQGNIGPGVNPSETDNQPSVDSTAAQSDSSTSVNEPITEIAFATTSPFEEDSRLNTDLSDSSAPTASTEFLYIDIEPNHAEKQPENETEKIKKPGDYYYYYYYDGSEPETGFSRQHTRTTQKSTTTPSSITSSSVNNGKIFCNTKLAATEHTSGLVVACGKGATVWSPPRCPKETFCMESSDTNYRICCPALFVN